MHEIHTEICKQYDKYVIKIQKNMQELCKTNMQKKCKFFMKMYEICRKYAKKYAKKYASNRTNMQGRSIMDYMQEIMQNMQNTLNIPKKCKICTPHLAD
jgi:hypothetical protein